MEAKRPDLISCGLAAIIGLFIGYVSSNLLGDTLSVPLASFLGFIVSTRLILGTSLVGALALSLIAIGAFLGALSFLAQFS